MYFLIIFLLNTNSYCCQYNQPQEADMGHSAVTAGTAVSPSNRGDNASSKALRCMGDPDYGDFYTCF